MIKEFHGYQQTIDGVQHLGEAIKWLPPFSTRPGLPTFPEHRHHHRSCYQPDETFDHVVELLQTATTKRSLVTTAIPRFVRLMYDQSEEGTLNSEFVIEASWFDTLSAGPEIVSLWQARAKWEGIWYTMGRCRSIWNCLTTLS